MCLIVIMLRLFEAKLKLKFICLSSWIKRMIIKNYMCKSIYYYYYYKCKKVHIKQLLDICVNTTFRPTQLKGCL